MRPTIFFDFGNVIGFFDHQRAIRQLLPFTDLSAPELTRRLYSTQLEERYERGELTTPELFEQLQPLGNLTCTAEFFEQVFCDIFWPNPPVIDLVPRLAKAGYRLFLASNTNEAHYRKFRVMFADTLAHFTGLVVSHEARARKPTAAFFEYAQRLANVPASDCVFIDDLPENIAGATRCGWDGIVYQHIDDLLLALDQRGIRC